MGFWELLLTLLVALVVIGPQRLPGVARSLGRAMAQFRQLTDKVQGEFEQQMKLDQLQENIAKAEAIEKLEQSQDNV